MDLKELSHRASREEKRHPWELARLEVIYTLLRDTLQNKVEEKITILDIGCGDLFFAENLCLKFPKAQFFAVDTAFDVEKLKYYGDKYKNSSIHVFETIDHALPFLPSALDVILLLDVVEHIQDDIGFLEWIRKYPFVKNETIIFITVPAFQSLFCEHDIFLEHYRRYNNKSIKKILDIAGYTIIKKGYFFLFLLLIRALQVLIEKIKRKKKNEGTGLTEWQGGKFISVLLKNLLIADYRLERLLNKITGIKLPGLSNYVVCRKFAS